MPPTTIDSWLTALSTSFTATLDTESELPAAAAGASHVGRLLITLGAVERTSSHTDPTGLASLMSQLGRDCLDVAGQAAPHQDSIRWLALAMTETVGGQLAGEISRTASALSDGDRHALVSRLVDALDPMLGVMTRGVSDDLLRHRLLAMRDQGERLQDIVVNGDIDAVQRSRPRPAAPEPDVAQRHPQLPEAIVTLNMATVRNRQMSVQAMLGASIACEFVARRCEARLEQLGVVDHFRAADGWLSIQSALTPVHDAAGALRPDDAAIMSAAQAVQRTAEQAPPAQLAWAMQRLPSIAADLGRALADWPNDRLNPLTSPPPGTGREAPPLHLAVLRIPGCVDAAESSTFFVADAIGQLEPDVTVPSLLHKLTLIPAERDLARARETIADSHLRPHPRTVGRVDGEQPDAVADPPGSDPALSPGYRIEQNRVDGSPVRYQVMFGSGRSEEFVGLRTTRPDAQRAARMHAIRREAQRSIPPPGTGRSDPTQRGPQR